MDGLYEVRASKHTVLSLNQPAEFWFIYMWLSRRIPALMRALTLRITVRYLAEILLQYRVY
jgi:hypothetical protein